MKTMYNVFLLTLLILITTEFNTAQTLNFNWTKKSGGTLRDVGYASAFDSEGKMYVIGEFFSPSITFYPNKTLNQAAPGTGNCDFFLAKFDLLGNCVWAKSGGGTLTDRGLNVAVDKQEKILVTGHYFSTATFDTIVRTAAGNLDVFTAKLDSAGNYLWFKEGKGVGQDYSKGIATDYQNNIAVCGFFGSATALTTQFDNITLTSNGARDLFLVKYNSSGVIQWGINAGGPASNDEAKDVAFDAAGNIYLTGVFKDSATFGSIKIIGFGGIDVFVAKYSSNGEVIWVKRAGGPKDDDASGIYVTPLGQVLVAGKFDSVANFGTLNFLSAGKTDGFVASYDTAGTLTNFLFGGGIDNDACTDVISDNNGVIHGIGTFRGTATFGSNVLVSRGEDDIFIFKNNGWILQAGGIDVDKSYQLNLDGGNNLAITGSFKVNSIFGLDTLISSGTEDIFYGKIGNNTVPVELSSFISEVSNNNVRLSWTTSSEKNNKGFNIEKTIADNSGLNWKSIGFVTGNGTTLDEKHYSFLDNQVQPGRYLYRLQQVDFDGAIEYSEEIEAVVLSPINFHLSQNYPNPFNPNTKIEFSIPQKGLVSLKVFDILGNEITTLLYEEKEPGVYKINFDGNSIPSGVYFLHLNSSGFSQVRKMSLIK
jgi:hypothetical protein